MRKWTPLFFCIWAVCMLPAALWAQDPESEERTGIGAWAERVRFSGLLEVEAWYENTDATDSEGEEVNDIDLATVELAVSAAVADSVEAFVLMKYEEEDVTVDEGFLTFTGPESFPLTMILGLQYLPFGVYETYFITDPNTLVLGETRAGAIVVGACFGEASVDLYLGAFNGNAEPDGEGDTINSVVAAMRMPLMETLTLGLSFTSNLAGSDALNEVLMDPEHLDAMVAGWSFYVGFQFLDRYTFTGEVAGALESFAAGELYDALDGQRRKPAAWNVEIGCSILENLSIAARYGGADDGGADFMPESQYGAVINWGVVKKTNLAVEIMRSEYEDDSLIVNSLIAQAAVEF